MAAYEEEKALEEQEEQQEAARGALQDIEKIRAEPEQQSTKRKMRFAYQHHERKRSRVDAKVVRSADDAGGSDDEHIVAAYESGGEGGGALSESDEDERSAWGGRGGAEERTQYGILQIIYCSRTHSQISQFVNEIKKTAYGDRIRVISLGARKNLCLNDAVTSLSSDARMSDKCLDMLEGSKKRSKTKVAKCPYYDRELLPHFKDYALVSSVNRFS